MSTSSSPVLETALAGLQLHRRGKVRDVYEVTLDSGETALLMIATDRISAFDYVLGSGIPDKGKVLTQLSAFWFERLEGLVPHHLLGIDVNDFPAAARPHAEVLQGPHDAGAHDAPVAGRVRRARLPVGIRLEGISADRRRLRHQAAGRPPRVGPAA